MSRNLSLALCLAATIGSTGLPAQAENAEAGSAPIAYVYVASAASSTTTHIQAFAAASDGRLTLVQKEAFHGQIVSMAVNGKYLFGAGGEIHSFAMAPNGTLHAAVQVNVQRHSNCYGGNPNALFLDHSGANLYDLYYTGSSCGDNTFQSFAVEKPSGNLKYLGSNYQSPWYIGPLSFIGNDKYAYSAVCDPFTSAPGPHEQIYGFERQADGMLSYANISAPLPEARAGYQYCPYLAAADPTNHVAISMRPYQNEDLSAPQLATYTADQYGNLSTRSTSENMPTSKVQNITDLKMSPSGKLLAVAGTDGLQIFHFNGSQPISHYSGLLTSNDVEQIFWDNDNHLYAIGSFTNKLYVFTVTPTSIKQAEGSPYTVPGPLSVIVQPKTARP